MNNAKIIEFELIDYLTKMELDQKVRELKGLRLFGYSLGDLGMSLANIFTNVFIFQYYVYTINLNSLFVSIGITFQLVIGAIFSIIFGVIVDNARPNRLGKRRPFLLYGLPIWAITTILIWTPPWKCPQDNPMFMPTAIYFWIVVIIRSIARTLLFNVYVSMFPEQSQTIENREKVASIRSAFSIISSTFALMLPLIVQSLLPDPLNVKWWAPSGKIMTFYIPIIGLIFTFFGVICIILIYFSVDESFYSNIHNHDIEKTTIIKAFKGLSRPARDKNFNKLVLVNFFSGVNGKAFGLLVFPFQMYVLLFVSSQYYIYIFISIFGKFGWYFTWKAIIKKKPLLKSYVVCLIFAIVASGFDILFLMKDLPDVIKMILYITTFSTILGSMYAFPLFGIPIMASLVNESARKMDKDNIDESLSKISGSYYGYSSFMSTLGPAFASIFVGSILTGENERNPTIITLLLFSVSIFYLIALLFLRKIKFKEKKHYFIQKFQDDNVFLEQN